MYKIIFSIVVLASLGTKIYINSNHLEILVLFTFLNTGLLISAVEQHAETKNSVQCTLCLSVASLLDRALESGKTEQELVDLLDQACNLFPSTLKPQVRHELKIRFIMTQ